MSKSKLKMPNEIIMIKTKKLDHLSLVLYLKFDI